MTEADLIPATLENTTLSWANLSKENLAGARCITASMTFANLNSCDLARANLKLVLKKILEKNKGK